jgi:hypothetical protein
MIYPTELDEETIPATDQKFHNSRKDFHLILLRHIGACTGSVREKVKQSIFKPVFAKNRRFIYIPE